MYCAESSLGVSIEPVTERDPAPRHEVIDGRYRVGRSLGQGGMGLVYAAHDLWLDRPVAIKLVDPTQTTPDALESFEKEARALAQIRHRNVVLIYAFGARDGSYYMVMEYVNGRDLGSLIEEAASRGTTVPHARALEIIHHVGSGLQAVHDRKLVHRDVKPRNIVIEESTGRPVLIDFGLARRRSVSSPKLSTVAGTPWYMAPEAATDLAGTVTTARADLYALACTAFELFTGRPVFEHADAIAVLRAHIDLTPPAVSSLVPELAPLDPVIGRAMAKSPNDRYTTCAEFVEALGAAARDVLSIPSAVRRATKRPRRVRVILAHGNDARSADIERAVERAISAAGDYVEIECLDSEVDLLRAFARDPADMVIFDDETVTLTREGMIEPLRRLPGGADAELLALVKDSEDSSGLAELGTRELPKPLNMNALATVIGRMGILIAQRRRGL
jgi:serine/threonine-protein kinase